MSTFRHRMNKLIEEIENDIVITNPKERGRTYLRKIQYLTLLWILKIRNFFGPK